MAPHAETDVVSNGSGQPKAEWQQHPVLTIDSVAEHRQASKPVPTGVASFSSANMFKSKGSLGKPKAHQTFGHRLNMESISRKPSSLKGAMKYFRPGTISLCGGLPSR
jgi:hypothetical protein